MLLEFSTVTVPTLLQMPPPLRSVTLRDRVLLLIVTVPPALLIPPPALWLPERVLPLITLTVPWLRIASPPQSPCSVTWSSVSEPPEATSNRRKGFCIV